MMLYLLLYQMILVFLLLYFLFYPKETFINTSFKSLNYMIYSLLSRLRELALLQYSIYERIHILFDPIRMNMKVLVAREHS